MLLRSVSTGMIIDLTYITELLHWLHDLSGKKCNKQWLNEYFHCKSIIISNMALLPNIYMKSFLFHCASFSQACRLLDISYKFLLFPSTSHCVWIVWCRCRLVIRFFRLKEVLTGWPLRWILSPSLHRFSSPLLFPVVPFHAFLQLLEE